MARERDSFVALNRLLEAPHNSHGSIRKVCSAVEECIANNRDNLRGFFDKCFPSLLKRVFGYDDFETSWLNLVTKPGKEEDARALVKMLSPKGKLFGAMQSADADQLIQFIFPIERLPAHTQELLRRACGRQELATWPQYKDRVALDAGGHIQVFLNVFDYYMFWTAFYVLRGGRSCDSYSSRNMGGGGPGGSVGSGRPMQSWGHSYMSDIKRMGTTLISGLSHHPRASLQSHPYYTLLQMYLEHFMPHVSGVSTRSQSFAGQGSSSSQMSSSWVQPPVFSSGNASSYKASPGESLLNILIEFWLTDVAEPLPSDKGSGKSLNVSSSASKIPEMPANVGGASPPPHGGSPLGLPATTSAAVGTTTPQGTSDSLSAVRVLSFQPPSEELVEALDLLVRYIHIEEVSLQSRPAPAPSTLHRAPMPDLKPAQAREPWLPEIFVRTATQLPPPSSRGGGGLLVPSSHSQAFSPAVQGVSRKLYRFLRRAIAQWPLPSSAPLTPIVNLWLSIIAPWTLASHEHSVGHSTPASRNSVVQGLQPQLCLSSPGLSAVRTYSHPSPNRQARYTSEWRSHVLSHLPFYSLLIPHFVELTYARMQAFKGDAAASDLLMLLEVLADAPELLQEIKTAEQAYNRFLKSPMRRPEGPYADLLPWLMDQALDWEASAVAGAPTNPPMQVDTAYRLFTCDTHSAAYYSVAVLRASALQVQPLLHSALHEVACKVLPLQDVPLKHQEEEVPPPQESHDYPKPGDWRGLHYRGDWMKRPIASNEIGILVRILVRISEAINHVVGLDIPWRYEEEEPPETVIHQLLQWMRRNNIRVSLRPLAEMQTLLWIVLLCLFSRTMWHALGYSKPMEATPAAQMHVESNRPSSVQKLEDM